MALGAASKASTFRRIASSLMMASKTSRYLSFDLAVYPLRCLEPLRSANWYYKAVKRALQGEAKFKYFQHAGALMTAKGKCLIKLGGTPSGYKLSIPVGSPVYEYILQRGTSFDEKNS